MRKSLLTMAVVLLFSFVGNAARQHDDKNVAKPQRIHVPTLPMKNMVMGGASASDAKVLPPFKASDPNKIIFDQADGVADIYGILMYDYRFQTHGIVKMTTANPNGYSLVRGFGTNEGSTNFTAMTFMGDKLFAFAVRNYGFGVVLPQSLGLINPQTGEYTKLADLPGGYSTMFTALAYDEKTNLIYATEYGLNTQTPEESFTKIHTIDPKTYEIKEIATISHLLLTFAVENGDFYGIAQDLTKTGTVANSYLIKIPASEVASKKFGVTVINKDPGLGINIGPLQSMAFDKSTHRLWWFTQSNGNQPSYLAEVDYANGTVKNKVKIDVTTQIAGLSIPYQIAADNAPSMPSNVKLTRGGNGALNATISWTNPTLTYQNQTLTSLSGVKIYRNGELVQTVATTEVGKAGNTWTDNTLTQNGIYTYKVMPYNEAGDGLYKEASSFVGKDKPGQVKALKLSVNGQTGTVSWTAPLMGMNGGYFDSSSLKYKVTRYPDMKVVADGLTKTSITDQVDEFAGYYYEVLPYNNEGEGISAMSNVVAYGPDLKAPYFNSMQTENEFNQWTTLDANGDGVTWLYNKNLNVANYIYNVGPASDYLISPAFIFEEGKEYQIRYTYWTINWVEKETRIPIYEKMRIRYGTEPTKTGLSTVVKDLGKFHTASGEYLYGKDIFKPQAGKGYLAFDVYSDADRSIVYLKDVSVREYSNTDLSVSAFSGNQKAAVSVVQAYNVTVMNEGKMPVGNYKVELYNVDTQEVLGTTEVAEAVAPGETKNVVVKWTPASAGTISLKSRIVLEGDTYPFDNISSNSVRVDISTNTNELWFTANEPTPGISGWWFPFNFTENYSKVQVIYLDRELPFKNISITGVQFTYNGASKGEMLTAPIVVRMTETTENHFEAVAPNWDVPFLSEDFQEVYSGSVKVGGSKEDTPLTIKFDKPFVYTGNNLAVEYERIFDANKFKADESSAPLFLYHEAYNDGDPARYRTARFFDSFNGVFDPERVARQYWIPYTMFSYITPEGVEGLIVTGLNLRVEQRGDDLVFTTPYDRAELFSAAGASVRLGTKADRLNVAGLKGVYILKATVGGKTQSMKITVR